MHRRSQVALTMLLTFLTFAATGRAQAPAPRGNLIVTVVDPSGAVIPEATVTIAGLEDGTKTTVVPPAKTTPKGAVTFEGLAPGRYSVSAEFPGFETGSASATSGSDRGDNKHVVVLPIQNLAESVTVARDAQAAGADRASKAFGLTVTQEQIEALSDDPAEMAQQIADIAGPDAIIRIDSFEGQQLPPKAQIKSMHVTRDQFAAETEQPGSTFVDVITQPGIGPIRGGANLSFRDGSMSAKSQFTPTRRDRSRLKRLRLQHRRRDGQGEEQLLARGQRAEPVHHAEPERRAAEPARASTCWTRASTSTTSTSTALFDYALTQGPDAAVRVFAEQQQAIATIGIGTYDLPERAFTQDNNRYTFRALEAGPIGRRMFINTRLTMSWMDFGSRSDTEAPNDHRAGRVHAAAARSRPAACTART